jgi:3-isopropylmalate dehydrogenase
MKQSYDIITLPGDGIGPEVMEATLFVLKRLIGSGIELNFIAHDIGAARYARTGDTLPTSFLDECNSADAMLMAAIGLPDVRLEDGTEVQPRIVVGLRKHFDLYAAVRPIKLYPGVSSPLASTERGIDFVVLRENTEGLFASFGGGASVGNEVASDTMIVTRNGVERISHFAFQLARQRRGRPLDGRRIVTCVDKANVFRSLAFFRKVFNEVALQYGDVEHESIHVDAMSMFLLQQPWNYDVLVMENMFGDILSDLGAGLVGGLGLGPSAEIGDGHALFQPSHGSAPTIAGRGIANPLATILSAAMMLNWLGLRHDDQRLAALSHRIEQAVIALLTHAQTLTPDIGGTSGTRDVAEAIVDLVN